MITKLQVKYIQSLGQKKVRDEEAVFVAEGPKIINELLGGAALLPVDIYATRAWIDTAMPALKPFTSFRLTEVNEQELERISFVKTPHQVLGIFKKQSDTQLHFSDTISLMLDGIQDPGNLGTIIRIADWFGISNIVCSKDCADAFAPKVVQATMGSISRVKLLYTDLVELVNKIHSIPLYAATLHGEPIGNLQPLSEAILVTGNESKGISAELLHYCKHRVTIPRIGYAESLNAAVATGIILSHLVTARSRTETIPL